MKKVSFMVALIAVIQVLLGSRIAQAQNLRLQPDRHDDRRTVEEALDVVGEDIGEELEQLLEQLEDTAEKIGHQFERWAEENSEELKAWSEKYEDQWERFGQRFSRAMESIADDQQGLWAQWGERYERELQGWKDNFDRDELSAENIGRFLDDNLDALSKMPLGQLVDQALEEGIGELRNAPWESLEELGLLAKDALQEPIEGIAELTIDGAKAKRALDRSVREMSRSIERLADDLSRNISDTDLQELVEEEVLRDERSRRKQLDQDPRIRRFKELLERDDITEQQRQSIEDMIDAIRSSDSDLRGRQPERRSRNIEVPRKDQILEKIEREKKRHAQALEEFNMDLRRSSEDSVRNQRTQSDIQWQKKEARTPKRAGGKRLDLPPRAGNADQLKFFRGGDGRQPRTQKNVQNLRHPANRNSGTRDADDSSHFGEVEEESESVRDRDNEDKQMRAIELLLRQVKELRKEVEELKRNRS